MGVHGINLTSGAAASVDVAGACRLAARKGNCTCRAAICHHGGYATTYVIDGGVCRRHARLPETTVSQLVVRVPPHMRAHLMHVRLSVVPSA